MITRFSNLKAEAVNAENDTSSQAGEIHRTGMGSTSLLSWLKAVSACCEASCKCPFSASLNLIYLEEKDTQIGIK